MRRALRLAAWNVGLALAALVNLMTPGLEERSQLCLELLQ